jgi:hypothetical protein
MPPYRNSLKQQTLEKRRRLRRIGLNRVNRGKSVRRRNCRILDPGMFSSYRWRGLEEKDNEGGYKYQPE